MIIVKKIVKKIIDSKGNGDEKIYHIRCRRKGNALAFC